jgi:hypothetical protein
MGFAFQAFQEQCQLIMRSRHVVGLLAVVAYTENKELLTGSTGAGAILP